MSPSEWFKKMQGRTIARPSGRTPYIVHHLRTMSVRGIQRMVVGLRRADGTITYVTFHEARRMVPA